MFSERDLERGRLRGDFVVTCTKVCQLQIKIKRLIIVVALINLSFESFGIGIN